MSPPSDVNALRRGVEKAAASRHVSPMRLQHTVASTIALQMVPSGMAKGGGAIHQRVSETQARLTTDLDFARASDMDLDSFLDAYSDRFNDGWGRFTGLLKSVKSKRPVDTPPEYLMNRFSIKLRYLGQPYCSVTFELVNSEIDSDAAAVERLGTDVVEIFSEIGLPPPKPVRVLSAEHQIVQKIHACTGVTASERAHDLIDIQILAKIEDINHAEIDRIGRRLFAYRQGHAWPPTLVHLPSWDALYDAALADLDNEIVLRTTSEAVRYVNDLIFEAVTGTTR